MTREELKQYLDSALDTFDGDGLDMAWYDAVKHIYDNTGDGGISENYIAGIQFALNQLNVESIGGD